MIARVAKWNEKDSAQQPKQSVVTVRHPTKWEKNISASYFNDRELTSRIDKDFFKKNHLKKIIHSTNGQKPHFFKLMCKPICEQKLSAGLLAFLLL